MTQRQAAAQCTGHATTNWLQRYNATARSSSRQHHVRVADLRCTVSSCFGKHLRSITHRIYSYQVSRLLLSLFCFVRHKTQIHVTAHNYSASAKSTLQPASLSRPAAAGNAMHVWQIRAVRCRAAVESEVRHPSHLSLCWSYAAATCCMYLHARGFVPARRC